jgi:hypothetical protein
MDKIRGDEIPFARFVVEKEGKIIAEATFGQSLWFQSANKLTLNIEIHPDFESENLQDKLYAQLITEAVHHNPEVFSVRTIEDDLTGIHFWQEHGFLQTKREPRFVLDLANFDPKPFEPTFSPMLTQEIQIQSLAEPKSSDPDWLQQWWQMEWLILQDMATKEEPAVRRSLDQFEKDAIIPEAFYFAIVDGKYVAITGLTRYDEVTYMSDLTWAIPSYQNLGLELILKLKTILWAKKQGADFIIEEALEGDPSYQINLELGFEKLPAWLVYEKYL